MPTGDVNGDGVLDISDIIVLISYVLGLKEFNDEEFFQADINQDGIIDVSDIIIIINTILG